MNLGSFPFDRPLTEAALYYASRGLQVLPLKEKSKEPLSGLGVNAATTDTARIIEWWDKNPNGNIGVACGADSGIVVVDLDRHDSVNDGVQAWSRLVGEHCGGDDYAWLPWWDEGVPQVKSGNNGLHLYFRHPSTQVKGWHPESGMEVRSNGSYVLAPPSIHPVTGNRYEWSVIGELIPLPGFLTMRPEMPPRRRVDVDGISPAMANTEVLRRCANSKNGEKFRKLYYDGNISTRGNDHSRADYALICFLAYFTQDEDQIEELFRLSALYRSKGKGRNYVRDTIIKVLAKQTSHFGMKSGVN